VNDLAAPGDDPEGRIFRVKLARIGKRVGVYRIPEIGLGAGHHPVEIDGRITRTRAPPGQTRLAPILDSAAAPLFHFHFQLQIEILRGCSVIRDVAVAGGLFPSGLADNGAVFDAPNRGIPNPVLESLAIENGNKTGVVVESDRVGFTETRAARARRRLLRGSE